MITEKQMMELAPQVSNVYLHMDNAYGGQCWDSAAWFMNHFGLPVINTGNTRAKSGRWPGWAGNMVDCFPQSAEIAAAYELMAPSQPVLPADTLVWDDSNSEWFPATHVATAVKDAGSWVLCWSQNSSAARPDLPGYDDEASGPTILQYLPKKGLLGIIRPRTGITHQGDTAPQQEDDMAQVPQDQWNEALRLLREVAAKPLAPQLVIFKRPSSPTCYINFGVEFIEIKTLDTLWTIQWLSRAGVLSVYRNGQVQIIDDVYAMGIDGYAKVKK